MKKLHKNYWRLGWVMLINSVIVFVLLSGPIRVHQQREQIFESMRMNPPPFSYWKALFASPLPLLAVLVLLIGIAAEVRRNILSPVFNLTPFVVFLTATLWERAKVSGEATAQELFLGKVLVIYPLVAIIAVYLIFYIAALRTRDG